LGYRKYFGVSFPEGLVGCACNNLIINYKAGSDHWIGRNRGQVSSCDIKAMLHMLSMVHAEQCMPAVKSVKKNEFLLTYRAQERKMIRWSHSIF
jgi:hypothetical protein